MYTTGKDRIALGSLFNRFKKASSFISLTSSIVQNPNVVLTEEDVSQFEKNMDLAIKGLERLKNDTIAHIRKEKA